MGLPPKTSKLKFDWINNHRGTIPGPLLINFDCSNKSTRRLTGNGLYKMIRKTGLAVGVDTSPLLRKISIQELNRDVILFGNFAVFCRRDTIVFFEDMVEAA